MRPRKRSQNRLVACLHDSYHVTSGAPVFVLDAGDLRDLDRSGLEHAQDCQRRPHTESVSRAAHAAKEGRRLRPGRDSITVTITKGDQGLLLCRVFLHMQAIVLVAQRGGPAQRFFILLLPQQARKTATKLALIGVQGQHCHLVCLGRRVATRHRRAGPSLGLIAIKIMGSRKARPIHPRMLASCALAPELSAPPPVSTRFRNAAQLHSVDSTNFFGTLIRFYNGARQT
jgi:hypothetical protein